RRPPGRFAEEGPFDLPAFCQPGREVARPERRQAAGCLGLLALQPGLQVGKRPVGRRGLLLRSGRAAVVVHLAGVLVLVAIDAQQLPVRSVGRIVVVVAALVVDGQLAHALRVELAGAARADPGKDLQRALAVVHRASSRSRISQYVTPRARATAASPSISAGPTSCRSRMTNLRAIASSAMRSTTFVWMMLCSRLTTYCRV